MTIEGTGHVEVVGDRQELVVTRTFKAAIDDVWASCTEPERLDRWIGTWSGEAAPGRTITWLMTAEGDAPPGTVRILECEPPRRFLGDFDEGQLNWRLGFTLSEEDGVTTMEFRMVLGDHVNVADTGPGWEYYMDRLVATMEGSPFVDFDEYYPSQSAYWRSRLDAATEARR